MTGKFDGVTCNVKYKKNNGEASTFYVLNYAGSDSLRSADKTSLNGPLDGTLSKDLQWFQAEDNSSAYRRSYDERLSK